MKRLALAVLLVGCGQGASDKLDHNSRRVGLKNSPLRVVHYSATW